MALLPALRLLCVWLPLLVTGAVTKTTSTGALVTLDVTSSRLLGHPIFGDTLGPYAAGQDLTLTCHTMDRSVTLTWWEGEKELQAGQERSQEIASATLKLETLSVSDSGRKLSCKAAGTDVVKTVTLDVVEAVTLDVTANLDILVGGKLLRKLDTTVATHEGANLRLNCISQGYTPSTLSWFEGDTKLEAQSEQTTFAASSVLALTAVSATDSGRRFSCRSEGGAQERVVQILIYGDEAVDDINDVGNAELSLRIILIVVCGIGMVLVLVIATGIVRLAEVYNSTNSTKKLGKFSELFKKHAPLATLTIPKGVSQLPSSSYTLI